MRSQKFPSAISRYLVSNLGAPPRPAVIIPLRFHPLYRGTWFQTICNVQWTHYWHIVSIRYIAVLGFQLAEGAEDTPPPQWFPSAISRYLVSNPTRKTPPLTRDGGNDLHTPRRIDHIPTFASLNCDKNTRSTHYTPNAGIEFSQAGFAPPRVNPVQNHT